MKRKIVFLGVIGVLVLSGLAAQEGERFDTYTGYGFTLPEHWEVYSEGEVSIHLTIQPERFPADADTRFSSMILALLRTTSLMPSTGVPYTEPVETHHAMFDEGMRRQRYETFLDDTRSFDSVDLAPGTLLVSSIESTNSPDSRRRTIMATMTFDGDRFMYFSTSQGENLPMDEWMHDLTELFSSIEYHGRMPDYP